MAKLTEKELEYLRRWRAKRNADPDLLRQHRDYQRAYQKEWRNRPANRTKARKASLAYYYKDRAANCEKSHWRNVQRKYGITKKQYEQILSAQGGGCALCGLVKQSSGKRLSIDHCHESTIVRGILCEPCNILLGSIDARPGWIAKVLAYLAKPPASGIAQGKCGPAEPTGFNGKGHWR